MIAMQLTQTDLEQLDRLGISTERLERQIVQIQKGIPFLAIDRPARLGDGIRMLSQAEEHFFVETFEKEAANFRISKFVPASGAATRMFQSLFQFLEQHSESSALPEEEDPEIRQFFDQFYKFPFASEALSGVKANELSAEEKNSLVRKLLFEHPFNFASKPKALLPFHKGTDLERMPLYTQLDEAIQYANSAVHFTLSEAHLDSVTQTVNRLLTTLPGAVEVSYSFQKTATDTIALYEDFSFVRSLKGELLFRPAGHGALIENLGEQSSDFVFIKNIDNVSVPNNRPTHDHYKKVLGGMAIGIQRQIHNYQKEICESVDNLNLQEVINFLKTHFGYSFEGLEHSDLIFVLKDALFRPLRVCGMVKNEGEPGGGPFWVHGSDGVRLQIVEAAQFDKDYPEQLSHLHNASHFNPVDLVCALTDYTGGQYALTDFVDHKQGFIAHKTFEGRPIFGLELPGLWNGAMAYWNTIFVEIPPITFNPVKTVNDLLRATHQ